MASSLCRLFDALERFFNQLSSDGECDDVLWSEIITLLQSSLKNETINLPQRSRILMLIASTTDAPFLITVILSAVAKCRRLDLLSESKDTPLHEAARFGRLNSVEAILLYLTPKHQLKLLSMENSSGMTPAEVAVKEGQQGVVQLLHDYHQLVENQISSAGKQAIDLSSVQPSILERLNVALLVYWFKESRVKIFSVCDDLLHQLHKVIDGLQHVKTVSLLETRALFITASYINNASVMARILSRVPPLQRLNALFVSRNTPLHIAAEWDKPCSVAKILRSLTAEQRLMILNVRDHSDSTPAEKALKRGHHGTAQLLQHFQQRAEQLVRPPEEQVCVREALSLSTNLKQTEINPDDQTNESVKFTNTITVCVQEALSLSTNLKHTELNPDDQTNGSVKVNNTITALILYRKQDREDGAEEEATLLRSSLTKVAAHVTRHVWSTASDLQTKVETNLKDLDGKCTLLFVSMMSHGRMGAICGSDDVMIPVNDLIDQISHAIPDHLHLVLLIQACQITESDQPRVLTSFEAARRIFDSKPLRKDANLASSDGCMHIDLVRPNTVLLMATATGGYAKRGAYTKALADEISKADGHKGIHEMHTDAVKAMRDEMGADLDEIKQVPKYTDTLNGKRLVLPKAYQK